MDHQAFAQLLGNYGEFFGSVAVFATTIIANSHSEPRAAQHFVEESRLTGRAKPRECAVKLVRCALPLRWD